MANPRFLASYFEGQFGRQILSRTTGPGWAEKVLPRFTIHYRETDTGASEVEAGLGRAYTRVETYFKDLPRKTTVIVYPDKDTMESALGMDFSKTLYSRIARMVIFQSPATWAAQFLARTSVEQMATHEFTHRAVNYLTGGLTPNWLDEGLAMYVAGQLPAEANADLARKAAAGKLYTIAEIYQSFEQPVDPLGRDRGLMYTQSGSLVAYLFKTYGPEAVQRILAELGTGKDIDRAMKAVVGVDVTSIEEAWLASLGE